MNDSSSVAEVVDLARIDHDLRWSDLAEAIGRPLVWTTAALMGQHPLAAQEAKRMGEMLELDSQVVLALQRVPVRGSLDRAIPVDPTIYRFYEIVQVYGAALKALIHEEFGDGIMSAINFSADIVRVQDAHGDRVKVTLEGKFLPYQWDA